jgi:dTMP kinase
VKGCFIVFEGTEGSGKTIQATKLERWLSKEGFPAVFTREPTRFPIGNLINQILEKEVFIADVALPLLFAADRANHTIRYIIPEIKKGSVVICDRYIFSSLAYQSSGMKTAIEKKWLKEINKYVLKPDLTFFLDIDPEIGLKRIKKWRHNHDNKFFEDLETQRRIRKAYYNVFNVNKQLTDYTKFEIKPRKLLFSNFKALSVYDQTFIITLDGSLPEEEIHKTICNNVQRLLKYRGVSSKKQKKSSKNVIRLKS